MNNQEHGWENELTAHVYQEFARKFPMYLQTSHDLVKLAKLREGMTVVDLACGTGITTAEILRQIGPLGKIYAIDLSPSMLNQAKKTIKGENVTYFQSSAEEVDKVISEKVDAVVSNSAIWQMDIGRTFAAVNRVLRSNGRFAFNIAGQFFQFSEPAHDTDTIVTLPKIMRDIARDHYGLEFTSGGKPRQVLDIQTIITFAEEEQFSLLKTKEIIYEMSPEEVYQFQRIPVMTEKSLHGLHYKTRMEILDKAYKKLDKSRTYPNRWIFFVFQN